MKIPVDVWSRPFNTPDPPKNVHSVVRPPIREILTLLPTAMRVGSYVHHERSHGREPIFDMTGITLAPPNPGPNAGVPCGGLGSGCVGRGYKGDFRRWSLHPGRYIHRVVPADQFSIRVRYQNGTVRTQVLSTIGSIGSDMSTVPSELSKWTWSLSADKATAYALYPRSWTVYEAPVPGVRVIVKQVSPFLPESYSEASLPTTSFEVYVENTLSESTAGNRAGSVAESGMEEVIEVSVMFTFQNGNGGEEDSMGGLLHRSFDVDTSVSCEDQADIDIGASSSGGIIRGVVMHHSHQSVDGGSSLPGSFAIACAEGLSSSNSSNVDTNINSTSSGGCVTTCPMFITEGKGASRSQGAATTTAITAEQLWTAFRVTGDVSTFHLLPRTSHPPETRNKEAMPPDRAQGPSHNRTTATTIPIQDGVSQAGTKVAAAVCHRQSIRPGAHNARVFQFSLAWDNPIVQFGPKTPHTGSRTSATTKANTSQKEASTSVATATSTISAVGTSSGTSSKSSAPPPPSSSSSTKIPRYYSRFFGTQGCAAWAIAVYGLIFSRNWEERIEQWQSTAIAAAAQARQ